jgi:hypothetical protein
MQGKGTMFFADGDSLHSKWVGSFEGEWKDNQKHGKGVFSYANGDKYDGMLPCVCVCVCLCVFGGFEGLATRGHSLDV